LENAKAEEVSLVLTDNLGRQVIKQVSRQSEGLSLDLSKMAAGVYMLNVKVGESNKTFKIVKAD
jgi:hypothetical protein